MKKQCIYSSDRRADYVVHHDFFSSDYRGDIDKKRLIEILSQLGFEHGGIAAEVAYVGIGYCIVHVHYD